MRPIMKPMAKAPKTSVRWYRSFYFRIGFSFVVFLAVVLVAQSMMFSYLIARPPARSPNNLAAIVAADIGSALTQDPTDRKSTRLNSSHLPTSRMPSSA